MSHPVPATSVRCFPRCCFVQIALLSMCLRHEVLTTWFCYSKMSMPSFFLCPLGLSITPSLCWSYSWLMTKNASWHLHRPSLGSVFVVSVPQPRAWEQFPFQMIAGFAFSRPSLSNPHMDASETDHHICLTFLKSARLSGSLKTATVVVCLGLPV